jgi:hypothetical protein
VRRLVRAGTPGPETLIARGHGDQDQLAVSDQHIVWVDDGTIRPVPARAGTP